MEVTIVASEFSEATRKIFQKEADKLAQQNYSACDIMQHLARKKYIATSMIYKNGQPYINCYSVFK